MKLNEEIVFVYAHICCDGNTYIKREKRSPSSMRTGRTDKPFNRYVVEYTNNCPKLLDLMIENIKKLFPENYICKSSNKKSRIQAANKKLYDLMKDLGHQKEGKWTIPPQIVTKPKLRKIWLRAFFDDEGCVYKNCIIGYNTNKKAIFTINKMLNLEGFNTAVYKRAPKNKRHKNCYTLRILSNSFLLFKKIGFDHTEKKEKYNRYHKMRQPGFEPRSPAFFFCSSFF